MRKTLQVLVLPAEQDRVMPASADIDTFCTSCPRDSVAVGVDEETYSGGDTTTESGSVADADANKENDGTHRVTLEYDCVRFCRALFL